MLGAPPPVETYAVLIFFAIGGSLLAFWLFAITRARVAYWL
jgi:hypothetical protein